MRELKWYQKKELLNKNQVAEMLDVSVRTVDNYTRRGMPVHKPKGSSPFFKASEVLEWVKS